MIFCATKISDMLLSMSGWEFMTFRESYQNFHKISFHQVFKKAFTQCRPQDYDVFELFLYISGWITMGKSYNVSQTFYSSLNEIVFHLKWAYISFKHCKKTTGCHKNWQTFPFRESFVRTYVSYSHYYFSLHLFKCVFIFVLLYFSKRNEDNKIWQ